MSELVFKINKPSGSFHAIAYNAKKMAKGTAALIHLSNFGHLQFAGTPTKKELTAYLEKYSAGNKRTVHKQFHAILSCKGHSFSHEALKEKALIILEELGYKDQPTAIYAHSDTSNHHIHIVTTRINNNGQKINDRFEKKRSANILTRLLHKQPQKAFQKDLQDCMSYRFRTDAQFRLLMERKGYVIKINKNDFECIKYGTVQGCINKEAINKAFSMQSNTQRIMQIRAIISKYQKLHDTALKLPATYTDHPKYQSALTNFLQKQLGLEFVFFTNRQGAVHGYTIIDHPAKAVYKGAEVIHLNELTQPNAVMQELSERSTAPSTNAPEKILEAGKSTADIGEQNEHTHSVANTQANPLDIIIEESEKNNQQTATGKKPRRKRRDFI